MNGINLLPKIYKDKLEVRNYLNLVILLTLATFFIFLITLIGIKKYTVYLDTKNKHIVNDLNSNRFVESDAILKQLDDQKAYNDLLNETMPKYTFINYDFLTALSIVNKFGKQRVLFDNIVYNNDRLVLYCRSDTLQYSQQFILDLINSNVFKNVFINELKSYEQIEFCVELTLGNLN